MKQICVLLGFVFTIIFNNCEAQVNHSYILVGLESKKIPVSTKKMTALMLPAPIKRGTFISKEITVQKVKGVENILEVKALHENFLTTNLNVYCLDGKIYSFDLEYNDDPAIVNYAIVNAPGGSALSISNVPAPIIPVQLTGLPTDEISLAHDADSLSSLRKFIHIRTTNESMQLRLKGIYLKDSLLWFSFKARNFSEVPFKPDYLRLYVVDKKRAKRTAVQQVAIIPVFEKLPLEITGDTNFAIGYPLFTISRYKKVVIELSELNGGRLLRLDISNKALLKARRLN